MKPFPTVSLSDADGSRLIYLMVRFQAEAATVKMGPYGRSGSPQRNDDRKYDKDRRKRSRSRERMDR